MVKKLQNSIKKPIVSKSVVNEIFRDQRTGLDRVLNEVAIQKLVDEMITEVETDENYLTLKQIYLRLGVLPAEFDRMRKRSAHLENGFQFCKMIIGIRRENGGLLGKLNPGMVERSMPMYEDELNWKKLVEWRVGLQSKSTDLNQKITFGYVPIANSDLVPLKKSESVDVGDEE